MNAEAFLRQYQAGRRYRGQIVRIVELPAREARYGELERPLPEPLAAALQRLGIERLYIHQVAALEKLRAGEDVVIVTGTASGKTLCYVLPVLETIHNDPLATALFLYPTKALAQDQLQALERFASRRKEGLHFVAGTYDGDTPAPQRRRLRDKAAIILTNPDMLHQALLPNHARWARFFTHLRFVVVDEIHSYRGVFGSHLANVLRRLQRICAHYGSTPQFVACSATIANPQEHSSRLLGRPVAVIEEDGSPHGPKHFVFWNPPFLEELGGVAKTASDVSPSPISGERRGPIGEAIDLLTELVRAEIQTIAFVRTRLAAELIVRGTRERLAQISSRLPERVQAYRGGYLPEERRAIEQGLASGQLLGVASTNALELGIDIGSLDACLMIGYPGTIASLWQQSGRAGRGQEEALVFLIADNAPIDQYLMQHPEYLLGKNPEQAVIDPDNPHIVIGHLKSALYELPLAEEEALRFGEYAPALLEILEEQRLARHLGGRWYWASPEYPAATVNLRNIAGPIYNIVDVTDNNRVIGTMDELSAFAQLHRHAVYLHDARSYLVNDLDLENAIAYVERRDLDYYTQVISNSRLQIQETEEERRWRGCVLGVGPVTVTTTIPLFKKVRLHSRESLGFEQLELPPQILETIAFWLVLPEDCLAAVRRYQRVPAEGLVGLANCLVEVAPMFVMCDVQDIGVVVDASNLGREALFLYDRYPGGMGYAERCADAIGELMQAVHELILQCPCEEGCPSCVGAAQPPFAMSDLESGVRGRIPDKEAALIITHQLLGLAPYVPRKPPARPAMDERLDAWPTTADEESPTPPPPPLRRRLSEIPRKRQP